MGVDKCTLLFHGAPLIYWSYVLLKDLVDDIIISVAKGRDIESIRRFLGNDVRFAEDEKPNMGPLMGIYSSFKMAKGDYVAIVPCDSPLIVIDLYKRLFEIAKGYDAAVPMVSGFYEPLHGVYKRDAMVGAIRKVLQEGDLRPKATYVYLEVMTLSEDVIKKFDPDLYSFFNINSQSDIAFASGIFKSSRKNPR